MAWTTVPPKVAGIKAKSIAQITDAVKRADIERAKQLLNRTDSKSMRDEIKVRCNHLRNNCAVLGGNLVLRFDANGIATAKLSDKALIAAEMDRRPNRMYFVDEMPAAVEAVVVEAVVEETPVVDSIEEELSKALLDEDPEEVEEEPEEEAFKEVKTAKHRGRPKAKGK